jgi:hypothetical protein
MHLSGTGQGQVTGCCEHGNESSVFVKFRKFLDKLRNSSIQNDSNLRS